MNRHIQVNRDKTGENLRQLISQSKFTYDDIADELNLTTSRVIYDWVNGFKLPKVDHLVVLSVILNVKLEDILCIEDVF